MKTTAALAIDNRIPDEKPGNRIPDEKPGAMLRADETLDYGARPIELDDDRAVTSMNPPSFELWQAYQRMYDYFNGVLFDGKLPGLVLNFSRKAKTYGFFAPARWENASGKRTHEISLNPAQLRTRAPRQVASTLVHEMVHLWQQEFGAPSRTGYHNHEWANKMQAVGLMPSTTGEPGGKLVGQGVSHYVIDGGPFDRAFAEMPTAYSLPWQCLPETEAAGGGKKGKKGKGGTTTTRNRNKVKYTCPSCGSNAWGKPELALICGVDGSRFEADE